MRTLRVSLPSLLLKSLSSVRVFRFARRFIEQRSAVLTRQARQYSGRRHSRPREDAIFTAGETLSDQERKMLGAARILAADGIDLSARQALKVVGMFLPTEWAQH